MKIKKKFDRSILTIHKDNTFSSYHKEITSTMRIVKDDKEQFSIKKEKLQISKNKVEKYIKKHHNDSLQKYLKIIKTI